MLKLGQFVNSTVKSLRAEQAILLHQLKSAWLDAVGPFIGTQTEPVKIKGKTLFLVVSSPLWAQEINMQQRVILQKLKKRLKKPLNKIVCWVGQPHTAQTKSKAKKETTTDELVPWKKLPIPAERQAGIEQTVSTIDDERLKQRMRRLLELSVQREIYMVEKGQLPCPLCGNFRPPEISICKDCKREQTEDRQRSAMRMLAAEPWLTGRDIAERTHIKSKPGFMRIRKQLLANLMLQAWQRTSGMEGEEIGKSMDNDLRTLLLDITMLRCSLPAHSLKPKHFYYALGKRLASGYLNED